MAFTPFILKPVCVYDHLDINTNFNVRLLTFSRYHSHKYDLYLIIRFVSWAFKFHVTGFKPVTFRWYEQKTLSLNHRARSKPVILLNENFIKPLLHLKPKSSIRYICLKSEFFRYESCDTK